MLDFRDEVQAFEAALPDLLRLHDGEFVVIQGSEVKPPTFPSYEEALGWGYEHFGLSRFFVKQVTDASHTVHFMRGFAA